MCSFLFFHSLVVEKVRIAYLVLEKGEVSHLLHSLSLVPYGGCLALAVAARNPTIDLVVILVNPGDHGG